MPNERNSLLRFEYLFLRHLTIPREIRNIVTVKISIYSVIASTAITLWIIFCRIVNNTCVLAIFAIANPNGFDLICVFATIKTNSIGSTANIWKKTKLVHDCNLLFVFLINIIKFL